MAICIDNDQSKQLNGVWTEYEGSKFKIVHMNNLAFQRKFGRLQRPHRRKIDKGTIDPEKSKQILIQSICGTILIDWKNVRNSANEDIPFDTDVAELALSNNFDLLDFVQDFAMDLENFKNEELEEAGKSLKNT